MYMRILYNVQSKKSVATKVFGRSQHWVGGCFGWYLRYVKFESNNK